jgi:hypothetical protein
MVSITDRAPEWLGRLTGAHQHRAFGGSAGLQSRVCLGLMLLVGDGLAGLTPFPDSGFGRKQDPASTALFGYFRIQRKNPRFSRQQVRVVEIAIAHMASRWVKRLTVGWDRLRSIFPIGTEETVSGPGMICSVTLISLQCTSDA